MKGLDTINTEDIIAGKINTIRQVLQISYTTEERQRFNEWKLKIQENSLEKPIEIKDELEILHFLPSVANCDNENIQIFFIKDEGLLKTKITDLLGEFSRSNPDFEIGITIHDEKRLSVTIGNKESHNPDYRGEYFAHYHPISTIANIQNKEELPVIFLEGMMPSRGDIKLFEKVFKQGQRVTRIFSKYGFNEISVPESFEGFSPEAVEQFASVYFDLFLGQNKLGLKTREEIINYFKTSFGLYFKITLFTVGE